MLAEWIELIPSATEPLGRFSKGRVWLLTLVSQHTLLCIQNALIWWQLSKFLLRELGSPPIQATFLPSFMATVDWSLLPFPSIALLNLPWPYHSTVWDFFVFMLLPCINVLQYSL